MSKRPPLGDEGLGSHPTAGESPAPKPHSELAEKVRGGIVRPVAGVPGAIHPYRPTAKQRKIALAALDGLVEQLEAAQREVAEWRDDAELKQGEEVKRLRAVIECELRYTHGADTIDRLRAALYPAKRQNDE